MIETQPSFNLGNQDFVAELVKVDVDKSIIKTNVFDLKQQGLFFTLSGMKFKSINSLFCL